MPGGAVHGSTGIALRPRLAPASLPSGSPHPADAPHCHLWSQGHPTCRQPHHRLGEHLQHTAARGLLGSAGWSAVCAGRDVPGKPTASSGVSHAETVPNSMGGERCPAKAAASNLPPPCPSRPQAPHARKHRISATPHPPAPSHSAPQAPSCIAQARTPSLHHTGCSWHPDEIWGTEHVLSPLWWPCFPSHMMPGCFEATARLRTASLGLHSLLRQVLCRRAAENWPLAGLLQLAQPYGRSLRTAEPTAGMLQPMAPTQHRTPTDLAEAEPSHPLPSVPPCAYRTLFTHQSRHKTGGSSSKAGAAEPCAALCQPCPHGALCLAAIPLVPSV